MNLPLQTCEVRTTSGWSHIGLLFTHNERVVVLLNNIVNKAYLGPLQNIRHKHIEPEADILVLPRNQVIAVNVLEEIQ